MPMEHIPKFVWWPIAGSIWMLCAFIIVFTYMLYRAKTVEIDLSQYRIKLQYADQKIESAQKIISETVELIDEITTRSEFSTKVVCAHPDIVNKSNLFLQSSSKGFQNQKAQLKKINSELQQLRDSL